MKGLTLYYEAYGNQDGPLIIFLHGGGVSSWMWDRQVAYFTDYHCVAVDLPEQGKNERHDTFSIEGSSHKVIQLIEDKANGKSITAVGFSLGAQVLIHMLSMKPDLIDYAIINSAAVRPSSIGNMLMSPLITLSFPLVQNKHFSKLQARTLYIGEEHFETYYNESRQMERQTLIRILKENMSFDIPNTFSKANGKILVTVGEKENRMMKKSALDIMTNNQNCTGVMIGEVGHGVSLAQPEFFNHMIEEWITGAFLPREIML